MAYAQLREVFHKIHRAHRDAARCCAGLTDESDSRLALLAEIFRKRERDFARRLKAFEDSEHASLVETWIQYVPFEGVEDALTALQAESDRASSTTLEKCLELQQQLARFLRELAENRSAPQVEEFLQSLADAEENAARALGAAIVTENDI